MKRMLLFFWLVAVCIALAEPVPGPSKLPYTNDFQQAQVGKLPDDFMVLEGAFAVKEEGGNRFLELPGTPLDTYDLLFGPTEISDVAISARVYGTSSGRRAPTFRIGLNGRPGFKLQLSPGKKLVELKKDEDVVASAPFNWQSGAWTILKLQFRKVKEGQWIAEGKVWPAMEKEPAAWRVSHTDMAEPIPGRALIGAAPYAGTPVRFDDLGYTQVVPSR